jgi:hypothetical protein
MVWHIFFQFVPAIPAWIDKIRTGKQDFVSLSAGLHYACLLFCGILPHILHETISNGTIMAAHDIGYQ